jgi:hypothetical protein
MHVDLSKFAMTILKSTAGAASFAILTITISCRVSEKT